MGPLNGEQLINEVRRYARMFGDAYMLLWLQSLLTYLRSRSGDTKDNLKLILANEVIKTEAIDKFQIVMKPTENERGVMKGLWAGSLPIAKSKGKNNGRN